MSFIPDKSRHNKFAFRNLNSPQYKPQSQQYSKVKAGGIGCVYGWMSGTEIVGVVTNIGKGIDIDYGKCKFAIVYFTACSQIASPALVRFTNASKIVNISKSIHVTAKFGFECVEDSTNLAFLLIDLALFGQPILKYHHVLDLDSPLPVTRSNAELARLVDPSLYRERLETF